MLERHRKVIDKLVELHRGDPRKIALVICGSVATGRARPDSDVDLHLVVTDEEFARARRTSGTFCGSWDPTAFFGVEVDGKLVGMQWLREAALRGSEPTRASFESARVEFSRDPEVAVLVERIARYPEAERRDRIRAFYAHVKHYRYVGEQAFEKGDAYFAGRCVSELVFFSARLVLAHNRVLFPCHKGLFGAVARCRELPERFEERSLELLRRPDWPTALAYYEHVIGYFQAYDFPDPERIGLILENEWSWFTGRTSVEDW